MSAARLTCMAVLALVIGADARLAGGAVPTRAAAEFVDSAGVNVHLGYRKTGYYDEFPRVAAALAELGVHHVRDNLVGIASLYDGGPVPARWRALSQAGVRVTLIANLALTPAEALRVAALAPEAIEAIEGPNEIDGRGIAAWPAQVRTFQTDLYRLAQGSPWQGEILAPSLSRAERYALLGDLSGVADFGNIHSYPGGRPPETSLDDFRRAGLLAVPGKPLVATETGYHRAVTTTNGHLPASDAAAAKYLPRLLLTYFNAGIRRTYLYQLLDEKADPAFTDREQHFGLLTHDFQPKSSFTSVANLLALLADPGPGPAPAVKPLLLGLPGADRDVRVTVLQKRDGRYFAALWLERPSYDPRARRDLPAQSVRTRVALPPGVRRVRLYQPRLSREPLRAWPGAAELSIDVPDEVILLEIEMV